MSILNDLLKDYGIKEELIGYLSFAILAFIILLICLIANIIVKKIVLRILTRIIINNKYQWDNIMLEHKVFQRLAKFVPAIIVYVAAPMFGDFVGAIRLVASTYLLIAAVFVFNAVIDSINDIYRTYPVSNIRPIKGLLQVVKIGFYIIIGIVIIANLMGQSPLILLSGIGALAAVFSFVFKDSILGFIAGIQLTSNDMLRIGDWIEMPKYGADGDVIDITLNTIKVQNFDKTIVTIPAYALVSDSFKNWRGMTEIGARRIKRAIYLDMNSIGFCTPEMLEKFKKIQLLKDYVIEKENEIQRYNDENEVDTELLINGRHLTNIGMFRAYIQLYMKSNPRLHKGLAQSVRQLPPGEHGLPLEIYAFSTEIKWEGYEVVIADIFDHIFSVIDEFELRIFQKPSGYDMRHSVKKPSGYDMRTSVKKSSEE